MAGRPRKTASEHAAKGNYRVKKHGPLPIATDSAAYLPFLREEVAGVQAEMKRLGPAGKGYGGCVKNLDTLMKQIAAIELRNAVAAPPKPNIVARPKTSLDKAGPPK